LRRRGTCLGGGIDLLTAAGLLNYFVNKFLLRLLREVPASFTHFFFDVFHVVVQDVALPVLVLVRGKVAIAVLAAFRVMNIAHLVLTLLVGLVEVVLAALVPRRG
jgi:hypothetical protein